MQSMKEGPAWTKDRLVEANDYMVLYLRAMSNSLPSQ